MTKLNTHVLRERFTLRNPNAEDDAMVIGSNRMILPLINHEGNIHDTLIIRGKLAHEVIRLAAALLKEFQDNGPFLNRQPAFDWDSFFDALRRDFDKSYHKENWLTVYRKGKPVFTHGAHHPFLDIIEQCDVKNSDEYDFSVAMAEQAFRDAGKSISIDHLSTIALVINVLEDSIRCGVIHRGANKTSTFNFHATLLDDVTKDNPKAVDLAHTIRVCASFIEGLNLAFIVGQLDAKSKKTNFDSQSAEAAQLQAAKKLIQSIDTEIDQYLESYSVRFRPERPDLELAVKDASKFVSKK